MVAWLWSLMVWDRAGIESNAVLRYSDIRIGGDFL